MEAATSGGPDYWAWREEVMRHPDGRAEGGEPCAVCGEPVPASAHWKHRDRHVCSARCNRSVSRRFRKLLRDGELIRPEPMASPRTRPRPAHFGEEPSNTNCRYEFDGFSPLPGDSVERFGSTTRYSVEPDSTYGSIFVATHESGARALYFASESGGYRRVEIARIGPEGQSLERGEPFDVNGRSFHWTREIIRDVTGDRQPYDWEAPICVPADSPSLMPIWTAAYEARSKRLREAAQTRARHIRRVRASREDSESFPASEVFERDGWICGICHQPIDPETPWPDPMSVSLDHIVPLVAGGPHSRDNCQPAHLICNVRKGARTA